MTTTTTTTLLRGLRALSLGRLALPLLSLALCGLPLCGQTLQLADGQVLLAKVEDAYGEGLRVQRLDNGGVLELRWDHLSPECALRIKRDNGLAGEDQGELTVQAHEVRYLINGTPQTMIGRIVDEDPSATVLVVQNKGVPYRIPRSEITQVRQIEVPVAQIFTADDFYAQRLGEVAPGENADLHVRLAEDLVRVRDYARALEHLERAAELGNSRAPGDIDRLHKRVKLYIEAKKERDILDQIQVARARANPREFLRGRELIAQFQQQYPDSRLKAEFNQERERFEQARTRFYAQKVAEAWRRAIQYVGDRKLQEPGLTLAQVRDYAETKMSDDIADAVAQRLELDVQEVNDLWAIRDNYPVGRRPEHFSYGIGSWVLGEQAILKDTKQGKDAAQEAPDADARELERITRAIRKMMEQRRAAGGGGGSMQEQTDEEWWADIDRQEKGGWLRAYYAENGGKLNVTSAYVQPCFSCGALGTQHELGPNNKVIKVKCYLCHGTKWLRTFKAF